MNSEKNNQIVVNQHFASQEARYEYIIEDENSCCLCGTDLKFQHKVDYMALTIKEDAHCPTCKIQMKTSEHVLQ